MKLEIIHELANSRTTKQIASDRRLSVKTVQWHIQNIYRLLKFPKSMNRMALLTAWAVRQGMALAVIELALLPQLFGFRA